LELTFRRCKLTRKEIRDLTRKRLGETTAAFWTDVELNTWINDAGSEIAIATKCLKSNAYLTTVEDTAEYLLTAVASGINMISDVYLYLNGTTWEKLIPTSRNELDIFFPGWRSADSGTPDHYYWDREENLFGIYLKPNSDNSGTDYVRAYFSKDYTDVSSDDSTPALPEFLHMAMSDYTTALGYEQRGYGDKANDAWSKYHQRLQGYHTIRNTERTEDEEIIMKPERNL